MSFINAIKGAAQGVKNSRAARASRPNEPEPERIDDDAQFCTDCGHQAAPSTDTPGSILIELVLWLCFIVPGLIYSLWRHNKRRPVCAMCGGAHLIPAKSPKAIAARQAMRQA
jgi:hypothetical protein